MGIEAARILKFSLKKPLVQILKTKAVSSESALQYILYKHEIDHVLCCKVKVS
jgi:hypothetical protein